MNRSKSGMTLVEVMMATLILGVGIVALMQGIGACSEVFNASAFIHQAANVLSRGEVEYPLIIKDDPEEDLVVDADGNVMDGWTFERSVEEDDDEDGLFVVRTKVVKGRGGTGMEMEVLRLVYFKK